MADGIPTPTTPEQQLIALADAAKESGDDFKIKVFRKTNLNSNATDTVAIMGGAKLVHATDPETWLLKLAGGGNYILHVFGSATGKLAAILPVPPIRAEPSIANPAVLQTADWNGPAVLIYPTPADLEALKPSTGLEKKVVVPQIGPPQQQAQQPRNDFAQEAYYAARERDMLEKQHKAELEALRRENELQAKRMEQKLADLAATAQQPRGPDTITVLLTTLTPIVMEFFKQNRETEIRRLEMEQKRAEDLAKRPLIDPEIKALIDKSMTQSQEQGKMLSQLFDGVGQMARSMVQTVATISDLQLNQNRGQPAEDSGINWSTLIKGVFEVFATMAAQREQKTGIPSAVTQPQLPAGTPVQQPQPPAQQPKSDPAHLSEAPPKPEEPEEEDPPALEQFKQALIEHVDAVTVVDAFIEASKTEEDVKAICKSQDALVGWFQNALGEEWFKNAENLQYIMKVGEVFQSKAKALGLV